MAQERQQCPCSKRSHPRQGVDMVVKERMAKEAGSEEYTEEKKDRMRKHKRETGNNMRSKETWSMGVGQPEGGLGIDWVVTW